MMKGAGVLRLGLFGLLCWTSCWAPEGVAGSIENGRVHGTQEENSVQSLDDTGPNAPNLNYLEVGSDCYLSPMSLNGLQCDREGFFITDFSESVWWDPGQLFPQDWLRVPASQALCCRVKLGSNTTLGTNTAKPVGIISVGCHTSTNTGMRAMQCETKGNSFITGFLNSMSPVRAPNTFYPVDGPECCTPVALLDNGDAWGIERCDCAKSQGDISCNAARTQRVLWGFELCGKTGKHFVPLAPARCCRLCLGKKLHSLSSCADQNHCSWGNGACIMGTCKCRPGFGGTDCSKTLKKGGTHWWQSFWWLGVVGFVCAFLGLFATFWIIQRTEWVTGDRSHRADDGLEDPFLDPEGSAGSVDTQSSQSTLVSAQISLDIRQSLEHRTSLSDDDGTGDDSIPGGIAILGVVPRGEEGGEDAGEDQEDEYGTPHESLRLLDAGQRPMQEDRFDQISDSEEQEGRSEGEWAPHGNDDEVESVLDQEIIEGDIGSSNQWDRGSTREPSTPSSVAIQAGDSRELGTIGEDGQDDKGEPMLEYAPGRNPLGEMTCAICFTRPVQVVLVPCGHSNLCRRCSRKLQKCPFCRREILRRQKLYIMNTSP